jgi:hypothetical protein
MLGVAKDRIFVEPRRRALPRVGSSLLFVAGAGWAAGSGDMRGVLALVAAIVLLVISTRRLVRPHRLVLTDFGFAEEGPTPAWRRATIKWSEVRPFQSVVSDHVTYAGRSNRYMDRTMYSYGVRGKILAALMNDRRLEAAGPVESEDPARTRVSAEEVYLSSNQPEMIRTITPQDTTLARLPEANGQFLVLGRSKWSLDRLAEEGGGRLTPSLVDGREQRVYFVLGEPQLIVVAFIASGSGSLACATMGAELAPSFWAAYDACAGNLITL